MNQNTGERRSSNAKAVRCVPRVGLEPTLGRISVGPSEALTTIAIEMSGRRCRLVLARTTACTPSERESPRTLAATRWAESKDAPAKSSSAYARARASPSSARKTPRRTVTAKKKCLYAKGYRPPLAHKHLSNSNNEKWDWIPLKAKCFPRARQNS